ncbi:MULTISPECIES: PadR family transcriptional regulator [Streptacidiphilus]|uniref:Helix-turn-helix transcriptional regulator n=1 Tax=Streptacidiphilus cavernicola TaxID=3342716 RepID=A0ABV6UYH3_9ACTN|nr:PadR family transcriptional regulator [Streptacidiphilus jeojiense]
MSLRHALLGLLREQPASGYDLMQIFKLSLGNTWPATQGQIYPELGKLADAGLLSVSEQGARGRKEYALTEAGLAEIRHWLLETEPELHPRSESLLRIFLLGALSREESENYLRWLTEASGKEVATLEAIEATSADWPDTDLAEYSGLALEYGKRLWLMTEEWSAWAADQVAARTKAKQDQAERDPAQEEEDQK